MKPGWVFLAVIKRMFKPRRRNWSLVSVILVFIPFIVFVIDQLTVTSSLPDLADIDIRVIIIEEHHEGISI